MSQNDYAQLAIERGSKLIDCNTELFYARDRISELEDTLRLILSICASKCDPQHNVAAIQHHAAAVLKWENSR